MRVIVFVLALLTLAAVACSSDGPPSISVAMTDAGTGATLQNGTGQNICTSLRALRRELVADDTFEADERAALFLATDDLRSLSAGHVDFGLRFASASATNDLRRVVSTDPMFAANSVVYPGVWWGWTANNQVLFAADRIPAPTSADPLAWRGVATHEMGHLAGFPHSPDPEALMCGWPEARAPCVGQRTLTELDRQICEALCECE